MKPKIDFYGQVFLVSLIGLSILSALVYPGAIIFGLLGLVPLGIWQLVSAAIYTYRLSQSGKESLLKTYWIITFVILAALTACFFVDGSSDIFSILFCASTIAGFATAVYYLYVYNKHLLTHE
jgi:hypothetical protein